MALGESQRKVLESALINLHEAFCLHEGERGETELVQFYIDTGDAEPNYTSRESHGPMSMVKNSDISTLSRALFSELIIYNTRQGHIYMPTMAGNGDDVMQG